MVLSAAPIMRWNICGNDPCRSRCCGEMIPVSMIVTRGMTGPGDGMVMEACRRLRPNCGSLQGDWRRIPHARRTLLAARRVRGVWDFEKGDGARREGDHSRCRRNARDRGQRVALAQGKPGTVELHRAALQARGRERV